MLSSPVWGESGVSTGGETGAIGSQPGAPSSFPDHPLASVHLFYIKDLS